MANPIEIIQARPYKTLKSLGKDYRVSFDVKATRFIKSWQSIVHFTTGGNYGKYGDRIPAVFFDSKRKISIRSAINGNPDYRYDDPVERKENEWINIQIYQKKAYQSTGGGYVYKIRINGDTVHSVLNKKPRVFSDVIVYISDPWATKLNGFIRNLMITNNGNAVSLTTGKNLFYFYF